MMIHNRRSGLPKIPHHTIVVVCLLFKFIEFTIAFDCITDDTEFCKIIKITNIKNQSDLIYCVKLQKVSINCIKFVYKIKVYKNFDYEIP